MAANRKLLTREQIHRLFAEDGDRWPPFMPPELFYQMLGLKSVKTVYCWISDGRLEKAVRKRGKYNLIIRDRAVEILFNGPSWTKNGKRKKNPRGGSGDDLPPRQKENLDGRFLVEGQAPPKIAQKASPAAGSATCSQSGPSAPTGAGPL
jgi:hypothetical protein